MTFSFKNYYYHCSKTEVQQLSKHFWAISSQKTIMFGWCHLNLQYGLTLLPHHAANSIVLKVHSFSSSGNWQTLVGFTKGFSFTYNYILIFSFQLPVHF